MPSKRKTIVGKDQRTWQEVPAKGKRQIFIEAKLLVVRRYLELTKKVKEAKEFLRHNSRQRQGMFLADIHALEEKTKEAKKLAGLNAQKECQVAFPDTVQNCKIWKWVRQAEVEQWELLPQSERLRTVEVPNGWRKRLSLPLKGRSIGGVVPMVIQVELDRLVAENVMGQSDISELRTAVTWQDIDAWTWLGVPTSRCEN